MTANLFFPAFNLQCMPMIAISKPSKTFTTTRFKALLIVMWQHNVATAPLALCSPCSLLKGVTRPFPHNRLIARLAPIFCRCTGYTIDAAIEALVPKHMNKTDHFSGGVIGTGGPKTVGLQRLPGNPLQMTSPQPAAPSLGFKISTRTRLIRKIDIRPALESRRLRCGPRNRLAHTLLCHPLN